ncbi:MAG: response regulator transcription factor [Lepagella sp.]
MKKHILVVDDEETLCEALRFNLEAEGYDVTTSLSAEEVLTLDLSQFDLVLLDIMMGDISGTQLAKIMKNNPSTARIPIIFCTAKDSEDDMVDGLDLGADDYITKPYTLRNVLARVKSVLRRVNEGQLPGPPTGDKPVSFEGLSIIPSRKLCIVDGVEVKMPRKEFEILGMLLSDPGRIFSRDDLIHAIWPGEVVVVDRVIDVNITRIRHKIGVYAKYIKSRSGYGYGFIP